MAGLITEGLGEAASGATTGFVADTATGGPDSVTITFAVGFPPTDLTGPSAVAGNWSITDGVTLAVLAVNIVGSTLVLTTGHQLAGHPYTLTIPSGMLSNGNGFLGPYTLGFTGVATVPTLLFARSVDEFFVDATFDFAPDPATALDTSHWSLTGGLTVVTVTKVTDTTYRVQTTAQAPGTSYTISFS